MQLVAANDLETVRAAALLLESENQRLVQKNITLTRQLLELQGKSPEQLELKLAELEGQLAKRNQMLFGEKSEKRGKAPNSTSEEAKQCGHGRKEQPELETVVVEIGLPFAIQTESGVQPVEPVVCEHCHKAVAEWPGQFEESEEIDVVARQFVLKKIQRKKACCECHRTIITAPCPPKLFEGARYSIDFALCVVVSKYLDHQPLERQVRIMRREGLEVESQTLWDYTWAVAQLLRPVHARLLTYLLTKPALGADETWWRMMAAKGKRAGGEGKDWWMWSVCADDAVYYQLRDSRSAKVAEELLAHYEGTVMCDGYSAYGAAEKAGGFKLAHCWSHVRRKFFELEEKSAEAEQLLDYIDELFAIDVMPPTGPPGNDLRKRLRDERSAPIIKKIEHWALEVRALPQSPLRKAVEYMGNLWPGLTRFLGDPNIPLSNNHTERALRGPVIGRKNFYGSRSKRGAEAAAILYSLCESAKLAGVEPNAYLRRAVLAALDGQTIPLPHEVA